MFGFSLMFNSPRNLAVCAALIGAVTVSYTHLDVYKRQALT